MTDGTARFDREGAQRMDRIAKTVFAPVYPVIAGQILERCGIARGRCVDIGSGSGSLAIALAGISGLAITLLDSSPDMLSVAAENLRETGFSDRCTLLKADVHNIPLPDASVDLVVSRGSVFFWDDLPPAFAEIYRILAPGGRTYIGGGFGSASLRDAIAAEMIRENPEWQTFREKNLGPENRERIGRVLAELGVPHRIVNDGSGFWIMLEKEQ
ncbi:class I SAM-dependent methyltransferase [Methanoculleus sp. FWC-SCC1]|uniref:Class I SAM-dependent methyltransferase n=1 Tax=Methanoculleus frigidifontis TaxID=2584085 RepID=A0ABT8MA66_9EURY|nr:class I SAM-dependent methyltransferase [Methanoculleus sp. FWC-SCC1]MDN7024831.1 class I SAM-dependent methyltransferase [Methanoculleus sp. FWC-SCC1]